MVVPLSSKKRKTHKTKERAFTPLLIAKLALGFHYWIGKWLMAVQGADDHNRGYNYTHPRA